jgi:chondroitin AC lyase
VNQSLLNGDVRTDASDAPLPKGRHDLSGARWVLHDGAGYVFAPGQTVVLTNGPQTGSWRDFGTSSPAEPQTKDVFNLWMEHGAAPADRTYEYAVLPGTDAKALAEYVKDPPARVVCNTPALQAVFNRDARVLEAAFYRPGLADAGRDWIVAVDRPCLLLMREVDGGVEIAVANPNNEALTVNVTTDRPLAGAARTGGISRIAFDLPGGDMAGSSMVRRFSLP